jgi:hypothetical protein
LKYSGNCEVADIKEVAIVVVNKAVFIGVRVTSFELHSYGALVMKRLIVSVVLAIALLTSGAVAPQSNLVGSAYACDGGGE